MELFIIADWSQDGRKKRMPTHVLGTWTENKRLAFKGRSQQPLIQEESEIRLKHIGD
jgi:hypothetical protein